MKKSIAIISVLLGATILLSGCGSSSSTSKQQSKSVKSDTLTYGVAGDPGNSVNVITTEDRFGLMEIKALYSPLYMYNADKVVYFLADSMTLQQII